MQQNFGAKFVLLVATVVLFSPVSGFSQRGTTAPVDPNASNPLVDAYQASSEFLGEAYSEAFPPSSSRDFHADQGFSGTMEILFGGVFTTVGVAGYSSDAMLRPGVLNRFANSAALRSLPELGEARSLVERLSPQDRAAMEALYHNTLALDPEYRAARGLPALSAEERTRLEAALDAETSATRRQAIVLATHQARVDALSSSYTEVRQRELERILAGSNLNPEEKQALRRLASTRRGAWLALAVGLGLLADGGLRVGAVIAKREPGISPAYNFSAAIVKAAAERIVGSDDVTSAPAAARGN